MFALRISLCLLLCAVLVQAYSDYYRQINQKPKSPAKYAATMLAPPKMNRFYRPRHRGPTYGGGHLRGGYSGGIHDGVVSGLMGGKVPFKGKIIAKIPVKSRHQLKFRHYPVKAGYGAYEELPQIVEVMAKSVPLSLVFRSSSSKINIQQTHESAHAKQYGGPKHSYSVDEPHILKHTVSKPIYQEIHELILPYRKVTQTVTPVKEEIQTHVATSSKAPALLNAYQLEPVLYMSPDAIKSQTEYKTEPELSNVKIEGYHGEPQPLVVSQYEHGQYGQYEQHLSQQLLDQQHVAGYEALQPVQPVAVNAPVAAVQPVHADGITQVATLSHSEPQFYTELSGAVPAPPPPVTLLADATLLDTYMKYAQLSTQDLLLPVYQQTHYPTNYLPATQHGAPQVETAQATEARAPVAALNPQEQINAALPVTESKVY